MEINKYFIVKRSHPYRDTMEITYAKGYGRWSSDIANAKRYPKLDSVKRLMKGLATEYPNDKTEILYVTEHIETVNDILEKELFDS